MKLPKSPPGIDLLIDELGSNRAIELFLARPDIKDSRYLHWDQLSHRPPPDGLSHREWWFVVKSSRQKAQRLTPFADTKGNPFTYSLPDRVLEQLHWIDSQAHGQIEAARRMPGPEQRDRYIIRSLMEEAITSSQLEGAATTRKVALDMLRSGRKPRTHGEYMIRNNYLAMQYIRGNTDSPLTTEKVFELHEMLTEHTLQNPDAAGRLQRPDEERVHVYDQLGHQVLHYPPPAKQLVGRLRLLLSFANGERDQQHFIHPVLRAIIVHFMLAYDHPFEDGNGRTARTLFYWSMLQQGYWLMEFVSISRLIEKAPAQYAKAFVHVETDDNDLTYFILQQLDVISRAIEELHGWLNTKSEEMSEFQRIIGETRGLNHRQKALLIHAMKHNAQVYTIESHQKSHGIAYGTSRSDLYQLAELGWLEQFKTGRRMEFTAGKRLLSLQSAP